MSVQTGVAPSSGPASQRMVDRARFQMGRLRDQPNSIWVRELKQAARLQRTPIVLAVLSILMTLLMATIGAVMASEKNPASTGFALYQVFFSLAYCVVTLAGPAVAANSIASEREGRTWEAVILTGMRPGEIARGKFLAAYTAVGMYVVMLAPVGALPFLFGGVTATEVVVAFVCLFLIALLSVAFGLAISSKMSSLRTAILVTLLLAFPMSLSAFLSFGVGLSFAAHGAWPDVPGGPPVWLPTAYARAPFDVVYVVFLFVLPIVAVVLPAWFLYEVTIANLTSITDDRSTGVKRWLLFATPVLTIVAAVAVAAVGSGDQSEMAMSALSALLVFFTFCVFLFVGDPVGPSRRVIAHWERIGAGRLRRFLGPGVVPSAKLLLYTGLGSMGAVALFAAFAIEASGAASAGTKVASVACVAGYALAFYVFTVGFAAFMRARSSAPMPARVVLSMVLFAAAAVPWVVALIAGASSDTGGVDDQLFLASPSPFYAFAIVAELTSGVEPEPAVMAGLVCMAGWIALGLALLGSASRRCAGIIRRHEAALAEGDRLLAAEDEAAEAARVAADSPAPEPSAEGASEASDQTPPTDRGPAAAPS